MTFTTFAAAAAYFATLTVAFPRTVTRLVRSECFNGARSFKAFVDSHNNICDTTFHGPGRAFVTFRATRFVCENFARYGFEVRHIEGDLYMAQRTLRGITIDENA